MENSNYAGHCSGASLDAKRMFQLVSPKTDFSKLLIDKDATKYNVCNYIKEICDSDLGIIFYAGHGGSQKLKENAPEEFDGKDEIIFLFDTFMVDDEIWKFVSNAKGRIFLIFDCCHSETLFSIKSPYFYNKGKMVFSSQLETPIDLICWSGCADDQTSKGSSNGGVFTNTILKYADFNLTYDDVWNKISQDKDLTKKEIAKRTILGKNSDFNKKLLFS